MHKYTGCGSKKHEVRCYTKNKWRVSAGGLIDNVLVDGSKTVYIAIFIAFNINLSLLKLINAFSCLLTLPRPNITNHVKLVNTLQLIFYNLPLPLKLFV